MKVLLVDNVNNSAVDVLKSAGIETVVMPEVKNLAEIIEEFDAVILRNHTFITEDVLKNAKKLKIIGRVGAGLDNIDLNAAIKFNVKVINSPDGNTIATAEHTFALILALSRHIPQACESVFDGKWERSRFMGNNLFGKTLGIIGFGRIGSRVAKYAKAFDMNIIACSSKNLEGIKSFNNLKDFLPLCDYISLHIPLTSDTAGIINKNTLKYVKPGAKIINCARGGLVVEKDLAEALEAGLISGVATDVFEKEPDIKDCPLLKFPDKVIAVPHLGANTVETQTKVATDIATQVADFLLNNH